MEKIKTIFKDFYKECVNITNVKNQILFIIIPYLISNSWPTAIKWGVGYFVIVVTLWVLIRKGIIYKQNEKR